MAASNSGMTERALASSYAMTRQDVFRHITALHTCGHIDGIPTQGMRVAYSITTGRDGRRTAATSGCSTTNEQRRPLSLGDLAISTETLNDYASAWTPDLSGARGMTCETPTQLIAPSDGALSAGTVIDGIVGNLWRMRVRVTGTYSPGSVVSGRLSAR